MRTLFKAVLATVALAAPMCANAIPMTWKFTGVCTSGDCDVIPDITGTLVGDPTLDPFGDDGHLTEFLIDEVFSYTFTVGGVDVSGSDGLGNYRLNSSGNIVDGTMLFGSLGLNLKIGDVGDAKWSFNNCFFFSCSIEARGTGSYSVVRPVVEPTTLSLLGLGLLVFGFARRRRV